MRGGGGPGLPMPRVVWRSFVTQSMRVRGGGGPGLVWRSFASGTAQTCPSPPAPQNQGAPPGHAPWKRPWYAAHNRSSPPLHHSQRGRRRRSGTTKLAPLLHSFASCTLSQQGPLPRCTDRDKDGGAIADGPPRSSLFALRVRSSLVLWTCT